MRGLVFLRMCDRATFLLGIGAKFCDSTLALPDCVRALVAVI
jgi:hypothetical protein